MRFLLSVAALAISAAATNPAAAGGSLENVKKSHSSSSASSSGSSSSSSSGSSSSSSSSSSADSSSSVGSSEEAGWAAYLFFRALTYPVIATSAREREDGSLTWFQPARAPYQGDAGAYTRLGEGDVPGRYLEVGTDGTAFAAGIFAQRGVASLTLASIRIEGQVMRLWEPDATKVSTLDYYFINAGINVLGASKLPAELTLKVGGSGISGAKGVGYGFDTKIYPARPLVIHGALDVTSFPVGSPLLFARFGPGITWDRYEVRVEGTMMHQAGAVTTFGPTVSLAARF